MPANYVLLRRTILQANASSVTFSNIPASGFTDLKIVASVSTDAAGSNSANGTNINFNGLTTNRTYRRLSGSGSGLSSDTGSGLPTGTVNGGSSNIFSNQEIYVYNYLSSGFKSVSVDSVVEWTGTASYSELINGLWSSTAAITSVTIFTDASSFIAGSEFSIYGLAAAGTTPAIVPFATGGDIVANDGTYWYHAFLSSGLFTPSKSITADCLVIAGGGGSSANYGGGGGGAGGLVYLSSQSLAGATGFNVAVGAGGGYRLNGSNSKFGSLTTAVGGGAGGTQGYQQTPGQNGQAGGSGGGGGSGTTFYPAGTATSGQGNAGGDGFNNASSPSWAGGGGGGAGVAGTAAGNAAGGKGGNGVSTYSSWGSATGTGENISGTYWYAGGGGGGTFYGGGATGGAKGNGGGSAGRNGDTEATAANGMANTGGGAGSQFGYGGSGIIIIRYPMA
jgi:hypothetical protein